MTFSPPDAQPAGRTMTIQVPKGSGGGGRRFQVALHQEGDPSEIGRYYRKNNLKYITYPYQYIS